MIKFNQLFLFILLGSTIYYLYHQFFQKVDSTIKTHPVTAIYRRLTAKSTAGKIISSFLSSSTTVLKNVSNAYILNERDFTVRLLASQKDGSRLFLGLIQPKQAIKLNAKDGQKLLVVNVKSEKVYDKFTVRYNSSVSKSLTAYTSPYKKRTPSETKELLKLEAVEKAKMSQVFLGHMKVNRLHPSVVVFTQKLEYYNLLQVRIRSLSKREVSIYAGRPGHYDFKMAQLRFRQETGFNTYAGGGAFLVTDSENRSDHIMSFRMTADKAVTNIIDRKFPLDNVTLKMVRAEKVFLNKYYKEKRFHWRNYFGPDGPRPPPFLSMWPAERIGDVHQVTTTQNYWKCVGEASKCQAKKSLRLHLEVVAIQPRVFVIDNFLNNVEVDHIISLALPSLKRSGVGFDKGANFNDTQRTSTNSWINRDTTPMTDSLYRRAADVLRIDESMLVHGITAESLQVVHYNVGQKYDAHHDFASTGARGSRYITLLLYLNDQAGPNGGGETAFPKGRVEKGRGFKVKPKKGQAVLFYNLLPDGNADDLSLHAALPVNKGEKWLANFWVWDPRILMSWDDNPNPSLPASGSRHLFEREKTKTLRF